SAHRQNTPAVYLTTSVVSPEQPRGRSPGDSEEAAKPTDHAMTDRAAANPSQAGTGAAAGRQPTIRKSTARPPAITDESVRSEPDDPSNRRRQILGRASLQQQRPTCGNHP